MASCVTHYAPIHVFHDSLREHVNVCQLDKRTKLANSLCSLLPRSTELPLFCPFPHFNCAFDSHLAASTNSCTHIPSRFLMLLPIQLRAIRNYVPIHFRLRFGQRRFRPSLPKSIPPHTSSLLRTQCCIQTILTPRPPQHRCLQRRRTTMETASCSASAAGASAAARRNGGGGQT